MMDIVIKLTVCLIFCMVCNITDYREYKVKNKAVVIFILFSVAVNVIISGLSGIVQSVGGMLLPMVLFPLFVMRTLGAGDIKLFCAIGSLTGPTVCLKVMVFSVLAGGVLAIVYMVLRRNFVERIKVLRDYLILCVVSRRLMPYDCFEQSGGTFRFSYGITAGVMLLIMDCIGIINIF